MQRVLSGQANVVTLPLLQRGDGTPLTAGTVALFLRAKDGTNAGKWWDGAAWQAAETSAGNATFSSGADWDLSIATGAWVIGTRYRLYAVDAGDVCLEVGSDVLCETALSVITQKTNLIDGSSLTLTNPVAATGDITVTRGDDYTGDRALALTVSDYGGPDISGASWAFTVQPRENYVAGETDNRTAIGTVAAAMNGADLELTITLTDTQTAALDGAPPAVGPNYKYEVKVTYADGEIRRLVIGRLTVTPGVTA